mgnify:CR=1 FL=1
MQASEVLSKALEFWGSGGERWVQRELGNNNVACLLGGLGHAIIGTAACYAHLGFDNDKHAYLDAMRFIWDELEACGQLSPRFPKHTDDIELLEDGLVIFNDESATNYSDVKQVVCGALTRALKAEEETEQELL